MDKEVKELMDEVLKTRKEAEERLEKKNAERRHQQVIQYVKDVLNIFLQSNLEKKSEVIVYQLKLLIPEKKEDFLVPMVAFDNSIDAEFYNQLVFEVPESTIGENKEVLKKLNSLEIPVEFFGEISEYFIKNLGAYLDTLMFPNQLIICLKRRPKLSKKGAS